MQLFDGAGVPIGDPMGMGRCSSGGATLELGVPVQARARMRAEALVCDAPDGTELEMSGSLELAGVMARFSFVDHGAAPDGAHPVQAVVDLEVIPAGQQIELPTTRLMGGGGDPTLWANFVDVNGAKLSEPQLFGGCGSFQRPTGSGN